MDTFPSTLEIGIRLVLAMVFGGLIGLEREWKRKDAGLRTHILVTLGAAAFTLVGLELFSALVVDGAAITRADPMRLVEGIAGGIGFLGAGAIITRGATVEGLTTASSIWLAGALGLACGGGHYWIASMVTVLALLTLHALTRLEACMHGHRRDDGDADGTPPSQRDPG